MTLNKIISPWLFLTRMDSDEVSGFIKYISVEYCNLCDLNHLLGRMNVKLSHLKTSTLDFSYMAELFIPFLAFVEYMFYN